MKNENPVTERSNILSISRSDFHLLSVSRTYQCHCSLARLTGYVVIRDAWKNAGVSGNPLESTHHTSIDRRVFKYTVQSSIIIYYYPTFSKVLNSARVAFKEEQKLYSLCTLYSVSYKKAKSEFHLERIRAHPKWSPHACHTNTNHFHNCPKTTGIMRPKK